MHHFRKKTRDCVVLFVSILKGLLFYNGRNSKYEEGKWGGEMQKSDRLRSSGYIDSKIPSSTVVENLSSSSDGVFFFFSFLGFFYV